MKSVDSNVFKSGSIKTYFPHDFPKDFPHDFPTDFPYGSIWRFPKMGVASNHPFKDEFPLKTFKNPPFCSTPPFFGRPYGGIPRASTSSMKEFFTTTWIQRPLPLCNSPRSPNLSKNHWAGGYLGMGQNPGT